MSPFHETRECERLLSSHPRLTAPPPEGGCVSAETTAQGFVKEPCSLVPTAQTTLGIGWHHGRGLPSRPFLHKKSLLSRRASERLGVPAVWHSAHLTWGSWRGAGSNNTPVTMGQEAGRQRKMEKVLHAHHFKVSLGSYSYFLMMGSGTQRWCQREKVTGRPQGSVTSDVTVRPALGVGGVVTSGRGSPCGQPPGSGTSVLQPPGPDFCHQPEKAWNVTSRRLQRDPALPTPRFPPETLSREAATWDEL